MPLNPRQQHFVDAYLLDPNATQAAIRAGYSARTAYSQGQRLLKHVEVAAAIRASQKAAQKRADFTVDQVLEELRNIVFADMGTYLKLDGKSTTARLDWSNLPEGATKVIQEITQEVHTGGHGHEAGEIKRIKFKLYSKLDAIDKAMRHFGAYFDDKTKRDVGNELIDLMKRIDGKTRGL